MWWRERSVRSVRSVWETKLIIRVGKNNSSVGERFIRGNPWESRVTEVIDDGTHLAGGEELTVAVVACGMQLS